MATASDIDRPAAGEFRPKPDQPPPALSVGPLAWVKRNLFGSRFDSLLTLACLAALYYLVPAVWRWAVAEATFVGDSREACAPNPGACWVFVNVRIEQFIYGFYPQAERWRANVVVLLGLGSLTYALSEAMPWRKWVALFLILPYPVLAYILLLGGMFGLPPVETRLWGGLLLTLIIASVGISASLPLGIALALGRRSKMPVIQLLSIGFIEFVRAVPLITVLFMASVVLPLFLPPGSNFDQLLRALIGVSLFAAAYMAEVVRGGLQAVPKGQTEAAAALGLGYWSTMRLIVLPQALRYVIPAIVSNFIGLFKDTTLVLIIGLSDLLQMVKLATTDSKWIGLATEGYAFAGAVFFVFCFGMSRYSLYLERKLGTGYRR
ncbi:MAG: amino acid ABC transporter permease [Alphaproteobacteria bacterium]|nr:amino acid ABC transporter permease [Alphaproteobacteria bacterium]